MNIFKRLKTLWILSSWDIKSSRKDGTFTIDGIVRPQNEKPRMAQVIKRKTEDDIINETLENK